MNAKQDLRGTLGSLVGEWSGRNQLWLEPGTPVHQSEVSASVTDVARGACIAISYSWEDGGAPHAGLLVVRNATDVGAEDMVWVDSFHTGGQFMRLRGEADDAGRIAALGSYAAPEGPDWGWRIVLGSGGADELQLLMYNIAPGGTVYLAVETRLARRHS